MMSLFIAFLLTASANVLSQGSIVFPMGNRGSVEVAWLGRGVDESDTETAWENNGQENLFSGNICYSGRRTEAVKVIEHLSSNDFLGDEFRIRNIRFVGNNKISYQVYDGPNRTVVKYNVITACR
jgi:hypothetical protein